MNLCLFDLDHTLIPIDSDHAWGEHMVKLGWVDHDHYRRSNDHFYRQYQQGVLDIAEYIRFSTAPLRGREAEVLARAHAQFMAEVVMPSIHPQALALIEQHRASGDRMAIVTATNVFVTRPIAQAFGVETLIGIELARDEHGQYTGEIEGTPSFQAGKVTRVAQWLAEDGLDWQDFSRITVYSDSINDLPLLDQATHPVATNPGPPLEAIAATRGWRQIKLFP